MKQLVATVWCGCVFLSAASALCAADATSAVENSVVKVYSTIRNPNAMQPGNKQPPVEATGSGVIIDGNRILTNAHVVAYASQVQIQANQAGDKVSARVVAFAPAVDLAVLQLDDDSFFKTRSALTRDGALPNAKDEVLAYGYPTGGTTLSITKGIVSRVEFAAYNALGNGLRVQIDAAINPGNSGGPVLANGKMIGLAFASLVGTQNISYIIPVEEIELFLRDIADGRYDGKPALYDETQTLENAALRASLNLGAGVDGIVVRKPYDGAGASPLREWDVVTAIGDTAVDDQGMVRVGEHRLRSSYLIQRVSSNGRVPLRIMRAGKSMQVEAPASTSRPMMVPDLRGEYPPYFIYGPLVFSAASQQFLQSLGAARIGLLTLFGSPLTARFADLPDANQREFVVVTAPMFTHKLSVGYANPSGYVVDTVNNIHISSLNQLVAVLRDLKSEFVIFRFMQRGGEHLVFKRQEVLAATEEILTDNGIRSQGTPELMKIWQGK
jgi:S1-C subfamily serine protease